MTENDADRQMAELKSENERLRALLHQSGIETADASLALARRDYRHERQLAGEQTRVAQAEENARLAEDRADLAEAKHTNLTAIDAALLTNTEFGRRILENSTDCIKVLDLEGLSLLKNLSDHRGCSSATATVGDARKFVRSRNPVTVIVKIESRILTEPRIWTAPRNGWKATDLAGATARFDDRCVLRLRDVRTDDGVHRPREMRRSCQRKAVGSSGDPDSLYLGTDAFCCDDNNENNKIKRDGGASH
jgi:hypothetical protein